MSDDLLKYKGTFRNSLFFLIGAFVYSFFYWVTNHNHMHAYGILITGLLCFILYKIETKTGKRKEWIRTEHVIFMSIGAVIDSLYSGWPFGFLH